MDLKAAVHRYLAADAGVTEDALPETEANDGDDLEKHLGRSLPELSMGMSHDFEVAIEEGATEVRLGTALFGARS